LVATAIW